MVETMKQLNTWKFIVQQKTMLTTQNTLNSDKKILEATM